MLSRDDFYRCATMPPRLLAPAFPLSPGQSIALNAALRALDHVVHTAMYFDADETETASLEEQLAAAAARYDALAAPIDDAMAAQQALAAAGIELVLKRGPDADVIMVRRRSPMPADHGAAARERAE